MRRRSSVVLVLGALAAAGTGAAPAPAVNRTVTATLNDVFTPRSVAVRPTETVTFHNQAGGDHNVVWEDGTPAQPPTPQTDAWVASRTFSGAGAYRYYCLVHGARGGLGMAGTVYVNSAGILPVVIIRPSSIARGGGATIRFTSTGPSTMVGTVNRRLASGSYFRYGALGGFSRQGFNSRFVSRTLTGRLLTAGFYRLDFQLRNAAGLSARRSVFFRVL